MNKKTNNLVRHNLEILLKSDLSLMCVLSKAGLGKTTTVTTACKDLNLTKGSEYLYTNSYYTPLAFYLKLDQVNDLNKPNLLILDDVELMLQNKATINLLKSATWTNDNARIVNYHSTSKLVADKPEIDFKGKIVMLINEIPANNPMLQAIIDRSIFVHLEFNNDQIIQLMRSNILPKDYAGIPYAKRKKVLDLIAKNTTDTTNLSFRTLIKGYNNIKYSPNNWQELTLQILQPNRKVSNQLNGLL